MDKHRKHLIFKAIYLGLLASVFGGCSNFWLAPVAFAQVETSTRTRLARPGQVQRVEIDSAQHASTGKFIPVDMPSVIPSTLPEILPSTLPSTLPADGRPFALGVEHKQIVLPATTAAATMSGSSSVNSNSIDPFHSQAGIFDKPVTSMFALQDSRNLLNGAVLKDGFKGQSQIPTLSVQLLSSFDLELIVDSSNSMRRRDCPGFLSRWEWCGMQTRALSRDLAPFVPKGLTLTSFASEYQVYPNSSPSRINDLFENPDFMWGTKLAEPLQDRLGSFFARRRPGSKPMLIAVITDGVPAPRYEPMLVVQTLINATKRMHDVNEVTVVFLQIGGSNEKGRRFLGELDYNLVKYGARFDIVRTVSFEHLQKVGLSQALVQSVQDFALQSKKRAGSSDRLGE
ncbi:hypothetical protein KA344_17665 [bacterium]|nr:hypothetical protein [bacterium]